MNLKKIGLKVLSTVIAMIMIMSVCAPAIAAVAVEEDTPKYVSLGASNANGYGLRGYIPGDMDEMALDALMKMQANVFGCGVETPESYPVLVADALGADLTQLAMSSMRAEELRFLLDDTYTGDAYTDWRFCDTANYPEKASKNWFVGAGKLLAGDDTLTNDEAVAALRKVYQNAIYEADYITVDIGVNNFGVYVSGKLSDPTLNWENDISLIDPALAADFEEGKAYVKELIAKYVPEIDAVLDEMPLDVEDFTNTLAYALVGFCKNFDVIMEKIRVLNPDATVVAVSIQNLMSGLELALPGMDPAPFGELFGAIINAANLYIAVGSPYADQYYFADVRKNGGRVEFFSDDIAAYNGDPKTLSKNIIDCFDVLDGFDPTYDKGIHVKYQLHKFLNSKWAGLAGAEVSAVYNTFESFMAAGANGFAELAETPYAAFIPTLQGMYAQYSVIYDNMLYAAYDVVASIFQAGANVKVLDLGGLAFMGPIEGVLGDAIFAELEVAASAAMNDPDYDYKLSETFFADIAAAANAAAGAELVTEAHIATVAAFAVRTSVGNSFFGHPSPEGHQTLATKILETISNKTTGKDIATEELKDILEKVLVYINEYYDEAYAYGYAYAAETGYIAIAETAIDDAIAAIKALEVENEYIDAELKAALEAELLEVVKTLVEIKTALAENKAATVDGLVEVVFALEDDLNKHLEKVEAILLLAGDDAYAYAMVEIEKAKQKFETEVLPKVEAAIVVMNEKVEAYLTEKLVQLCGVAEKTLAAVREYLYKTYGIVVDATAKVDAYFKAIEEYIINKLEAIDKVVTDTNEKVEQTIAGILNHIEKITMGEYLVSDDSFYLAIGGEGYAAILAEALNLTADQYKAVSSEELSAEDIAKADFITISYDNGSVVAFTSEQLIGYVKAYLDGALRADVNAYVDSAFSEILSEDGFAKINSAIDAAIDNVVASELLADKEAVALDWAALVGEDNEAKVDEARAAIVVALTEAGVPADYEMEIDVVEALYENAASLGLTDVLSNFKQEWFYSQLGANAVYTVKVPVLDLAVFAAESALYEYVRYNKNYAETVLAINELNPEATVALLGAYGLFDGVDFGADVAIDETVDVTELLQLDKIPAMIKEVLAQLPATEDVAAEFDAFVTVDSYDVEVTAITEILSVISEKFDGLNNVVSTVELPVVEETIGLILDIAEKVIDSAEEYKAYVADVKAKLAATTEVNVCTVSVPLAGLIAVAYENIDKVTDFVNGIELTVTEKTIDLVFGFAMAEIVVEEAYEEFAATVKEELANAIANGNFTVTVPVADIVDNAVFTYETLVGLVKLLSEVDYTVDDVKVEANVAVEEVYDAVVSLASVHPLAYAVMFENMFFVDISDVETNLEAAMAAGMAEGDLLKLVEAYLANAELVAPSAAGNKYIAEQILGALTVECDHVYDDECTDVDCNRCGEEREVSGHIFTNYVSNNDATCAVDGTKTATCDVCKDAKDTVVDEGSSAKAAHVFTKYTSNDDATCIAGGTKTATCDVCKDAKDTIADPDAVGEHKFTNYVSDGNATCTADGTKTATCDVCKDAKDTVTDAGSKKEHNFMLVVGYTQGTCLTIENTTYRCSGCTQTKVVLGAKGSHVPGAAATCEAAQTCTVCKAEIAPKADHTPGAAATCTAAQTCTVCKAEIAPAAGHKAGAAATCTAAQKCTVCNAEMTAALGHKAGAAATCTTAQTCTVCKAEIAPATGHSFAAATCKAPKTCSVCKATEGEVAAHTYENDCDVDCNVCGDVRTTEHVYGDWTVTKEATKDEDGVQERTCSVCGNVESEAIPAGTEIPGGTDVKINVGGIVGIVFAVLAVVGGGVAVVLFVVKKKIV